MVALAMLAITSAMSMGGGEREELTANDKMAAIGKFVMEEDQHEARIKRQVLDGTGSSEESSVSDDSSASGQLPILKR
ncbi:hypothetical protein Pcinc_003429 [Petrolisthes cinctipes]|uniref:Uncharacterized protein n=1 Tax=Petrolisthes cinctipes TaxID=88211 RepID=A0AAE1GGQ7_PETCI|nr:hypothetical protein Pcinc_003429 [Petrolisthes cinctipes]